MTDHDGSNESLYKSASSSEGDLENREAFFDPLQRPNFLSGTSESSLIQDERDNVTPLENLRNKLSSNLSKAWNFGTTFGSSQKVDQSEDDKTYWEGSGSKVKAKILGFEILEREKKLTVYKLKVQHCGHWGVSQIPNWFLYRRYNDFADLQQKLTRNFPDTVFTLPPKRWIGNNYDPIFIGHRIQGLNKFLRQILEASPPDIRDSSLIRDFLCLDSPPHRATSLSSCRALYDCFEETIHELRHQLRRKESLEDLAENLRESLAQRDIELESLRNEAEQLRKQREALIKAFDGGHIDFSGVKSNTTSGPPSDISQSSLGLNSNIYQIHHQQNSLMENGSGDKEEEEP